ncbi:phospholipase [Sulfolobus islandicus]|nr:phospholipase D family protein [Sulfolobus islandicus]WCM38413.1 phospholipase [Sulfolobus islandicus]
MSEYSGTKRSGIQALYTFTPFKLLFGKNEYGLILVPIVYNDTNENINWNVGIADIFHAPYYKRDFKVVLPKEIRPYIFASSSRNDVEYRNTSLLRDPSYIIDKEKASKPFPLIARYNHTSLTNGYYCKYGLVLLHSRKQCPLAEKCKLFERDENGGCKYYDGPMPYERLYTVFPHIVRRVREGGIGNRKMISALIIVKTRNIERILGKIEFSDKLIMEAFSDATIFYAKAADLMYKDFLWVSYKDGIGFRLNNLNGLIIKFNINTLEDYVSWLLRNNSEIRDWLCTKMSIYFDNKKNITLNKFGLSHKGFAAMDRFEGVIDSIIDGKFKERCKDDNLTLFGSFILVHTLAHVIISNVIDALVKSNISSDYTYYIEHPVFGDTSTTIYIVETIYGGFGYLKNISNMISAGDSTLRGILNNLPNIYDNHERRSNGSLSNLRQIVSRFSGRLDNDILNRVIDIFDSWRTTSSPFPNSFPINFVVRNYLGKRFKSGINKDGDTRQTFKDLIAELPLCWDGCNLCVGMDKGCMFGPYDQPFLISRKVVSEFLKTHTDWFGKKDFSFTNNLYSIFKDLINLAENEIKIVSPWIGKEIIDDLRAVKEEKDLLITVVCLDDKKNDEAIKEAEKAGIRIIKVPSSVEGIIHAKFMIIDDSIALMGSANLTINGLKKNVETEIVTIDPNKIEKLLQQFHEIVMKYELHE